MVPRMGEDGAGGAFALNKLMGNQPRSTGLTIPNDAVKRQIAISTVLA